MQPVFLAMALRNARCCTRDRAYAFRYLTRTILDVFNCAPTDPPDGKTYLEVVFEECGVPGGLQMRLLPFAIVALLVYTIG